MSGKLTTQKIIDELSRILEPLTQHVALRISFAVANFHGVFIHYGSDGDPPLQFSLCGNERSGYEVFLNKVGTTPILDAMPRAVMTPGVPLPDDVFIEGDEFVWTYKKGGDEAHANYGLYTRLCHELKPRWIMEIGVRGGYSAYSMLKGCDEGTSYYGIDLNQAIYGGIPGYPEQAIEMLREKFPKSNVILDFEDSQLLTELPGHYDLISVDGAHGHDGALHDLELCARHANYLIVDDVAFIPMVASAIEEFLTNHPNTPATYYPSWRGHVLIDVREI